MKKTFILIFLALAALPCLPQPGVTVVDSILSGPLYRKFRLYVPGSYSASTAVPLVLNLHGYTSNAIQQQAYANFMAIADTANFLVVHPDGTGPVNAQYWNAGFGGTVNDVQFLKDLIDSISFIYNVDADRVYSCGMSNGGIMSYYLACYLPNKIAAIASVTGSMLNSWFTCAPLRPFPVMEIHGTSDGTVPYNGDATFAHIDSIVKKWRVHNGCNPAPVTFSVPDINTSDNCTAVNYKYLNGNSGSAVELYKITGGSHSWPGAANVIPNTNQDFKASVEIWRFFRQYKLNQMITGIVASTDAHKVKIFPNPSSDQIILEGLDKADISVLSPDGKILLAARDTDRLNIAQLREGLYFVEIRKGHSSFMLRLIRN
jgi:polyhydroxybutyrate depolymerase